MEIVEFSLPKIFRRRNIEMERKEPSGIPDPEDPFPEEQMSSCALHNNFDKRVHVKVHFKRRNNNDLESSSSEHYEKHQPYTEIEIKQSKEILETALKANIHEPSSQCCIYKVPKDLRKINRQAYTPQVISIGPLHHGNKALVEMEKQKLRYVIEFHKRYGNEKKLMEFRRFIQDNEQLIRDYYQENSRLKSSEFVNMILHDAVFIIELFYRNWELRANETRFDFFIDTACVKAAIACDLQLLENQLPYLLLQNLFEIFVDHKPNLTPHPFLTLSYLFLFDPKKSDDPQPKIKEIPGYEIQHFTDLRRYFLLMDFLPQYQNKGEHVRDPPTAGDQNQGEHVRGTAGDQNVRDSPAAGDQNQGEHVRGTAGDQNVRDSPTAGDQNQGEHVRDLPTATKLQGSGVKFKKGNEGRSSLEISCEYVPRAMRIPGFKGPEIRIPFIKELRLQIPHFEIDDRSECLYRNMMALELCHYPSETHICNFILLMDYLINTEKDVDLFVEEGIIFGLLGDNAAVAKMFNRLCLQITPSHSVYHDIGETLKKHYRRPWNHTMATLNTVYFGDIWKGTATVAAFILLVLTVIQAISSILSLL